MKNAGTSRFVSKCFCAVISNSCAIPWGLLDLLPFLENYRISWRKFLSSYNLLNSYLDTHSRTTLMLVETDITGFIIRFIIQGCHQKPVASQNLPSTYSLVLTWVTMCTIL